MEIKARGKLDYPAVKALTELSILFKNWNPKKRNAFDFTLVLIVDKSTIEGGTAEDIRYRLSPLLKKNYYLCKY